MIVLQLKNYVQNIDQELNQATQALGLNYTIQNQNDEHITLTLPDHPEYTITLTQDNCEIYSTQQPPTKGNWTNHHITQWITIQILAHIYTTNGYALLQNDQPIKPTITLQTWLQDFPTLIKNQINQELQTNPLFKNLPK